MQVNAFRGVDAAAVLCQDNLTVQNDLHCGGNFTCDGTMPSPYWAAAHISASGSATSQKGLHTLLAVKVGGDTSFDVTFPVHPDGADYVVLHSSSEFHTLIRSQSSTGFRIYTRGSTNAGAAQGNGDVCIIILK